MTRQRLQRAWGEFQQAHPLIVAPVCTGLPFAVGADLTTDEVAAIIQGMRMVLAVNVLGLPPSPFPSAPLTASPVRPGDRPALPRGPVPGRRRRDRGQARHPHTDRPQVTRRRPMPAPAAHRIRPGRIPIRDASLYVDVTGHGHPLLLMHGGPGADHWTLLPFRQLADQFTLIFYDHRCNGRSQGAPVSSMTFENLTADADALRRRLGYERWAVLGHSFGGHVALEYALRYPGSLSHLVLVDTGGDSRWSRSNAAEVLARRGYSPEKVELVRRWFRGEFPPRQMPLILMRIGSAYYSRPSLSLVTRDLIRGEWRSKMRRRP
jgi:hypothetical protein